MLYMVTFTINKPPMLAYIPAPWILWVWQSHHYRSDFSHILRIAILSAVPTRSRPAVAAVFSKPQLDHKYHRLFDMYIYICSNI
jgi:hypothetical protein